MSDAQFKIDATIFCDDVRREASGKLLIIGTYITDFIVDRFPAALSLVVHNQGSVIKAGKASTSITIHDEHGGVLFQSEPFPPTNFLEGRFALAHQFNIVAHKETTLSITVKNGEYQYELPTRRVRLAANILAEREAATLSN